MKKKIDTVVYKSLWKNIVLDKYKEYEKEKANTLKAELKKNLKEELEKLYSEKLEEKGLTGLEDRRREAQLKLQLIKQMRNQLQSNSDKLELEMREEQKKIFKEKRTEVMSKMNPTVHKEFPNFSKQDEHRYKSSVRDIEKRKMQIKYDGKILGYQISDLNKFEFNDANSTQLLNVVNYRRLYLDHKDKYRYWLNILNKVHLDFSENLKLEIHCIPHSHMDLGWLNTYDGYRHCNQFSNS